ncbi:SpoIIE family protein phosphatase [Bengtsoniella intestinalis]|uniref:SpoIIE family protein phosphatase n=1 Tax=Bengtsoniella intestinalis TaxID=3073143 RepID=UPI00391FCA36
MERQQSRMERWQVPMGCAMRCALTFGLVAYRMGDGYAPLALGAVAASGQGGGGLWALVGLVLGAMLWMDFATALPCVAVGILFYCMVSALGDFKWMAKTLPLPMMSMATFFAVNGIYLIQSLSPNVAWGLCLCATAVVGVTVGLLRPILDGDNPSFSPHSLLYLGICLCLAGSVLTVSGLSVGRMFLGALVLYTACQRGCSHGGTVGLLSGLLADLIAQSGGLVFSAAYGLGGMAGGYLVAYGRIVAGLGYSVAVFFAALTLSQGSGAVVALEALGAMALYWCIPQRLLGGKRVQPPVSAQTNATVERLRSQLNKTATALRDLYESMARNTMAVQEENPSVVFDRATEQVCRSCTICTQCWQKDYATTHNAFNDATPFLLERGRVLAKDFSPQFSNRCIHFPQLLQTLNAELSAYLLRKQYRREIEETRRSARGQYAQLSDLLTATAAGLGSVQPAMASNKGYGVGAVLRPKDGETLCGDTIDGFETDDGTLCLLLCDGMGCGGDAQKESALMVRLLRQFLQGGITPEAALKTLHAAMALRASASGGFSTVDLLICHPDSGQATLYKCGGAPSYVKKGGVVRRITGHTLPMGMGQTATDMTQLQVEEHSFVVLLSDGISDGVEDEWLQNLLAGWEGTNPQTLANLILTHSQLHQGSSDDGAVQVLYREGVRARAV